MQPETRPRSAPLALWRSAGAFLTKLFGLFGDPKDIAQRLSLDARTHALIASWLRAGEAMLRQLILVELDALPETSVAAPKPPRQYKRAPRPPVAIDFERPETWRVSFHALASSSGGAGARWRERKTAGRFFAAFPVAARLEAMLRVFNDPAPFVERLSRRLMRRPDRVWDLLREPTPKHRHAPRLSTEIDGLHNAAWKAYGRYSLRIEDTS